MPKLVFLSAVLCSVLFGAAATLNVPDASAAQGDCGQPQSNGDGPSAADCLFILRVAVDLEVCEACVCDVTGNADTAASDALRCLGIAVGQDGLTLDCQPCATTTTRKLSSTTSSSTTTTSTTTTLPTGCISDINCTDLEDHRCNPNNSLCEKVCRRDTDCKDFFECDRKSGYCVPPAI